MKYAKPTLKHRSYVQGARAQAAEATARRIAEAFLARLLTQWYDEITLDRVAEDAAVTVQTVVRRFGGKEGLLGEAVKILAGQINEVRTVQPGNIEKIVKVVVDDYERTGDAVIRLLALEPRHESLKIFANLGRRWHREWISDSFAPQLSGCEASARKQAIDTLVIVTDVCTWKLLRRDMGRSAAASMKAIQRLVSATLAEYSKSHATGDEQ